MDESAAASFSTRLTDLLDIEHPILGGGLMWLSDARYVAALANAGCMGFITPRSFASADVFSQVLDDCSRLSSGRPFGVNLTLSNRAEANEPIQRWIDIALDHGVRHFETAGYRPNELIRILHSAGATVIHKASSIRHGLSAERAGADAVVLVGMEEGGHPGVNELPTMLMGALAIGQFRVPVVLGGGIGSGQQIAAALVQGADGVLMGSRFLVCEEISTHRRYKEHLLACDENSTVRILQSLGNTWRVLKNDTTKKIEALESSGVLDHAAFGDLIKGTTVRDGCYATGDWNQGMLSLGPAIAFAKRIEPLEHIVSSLIEDTRDALKRCAQVQRSGR